MDRDDVKFVIGFTFCFAVLLHHQQRRKIQRKISAWERDRMATIKRVHKELVDVINDPNTTLEEAEEAYNTEMRFLDIITDISTM